MSFGLFLRSFCGFALQTVPCAVLLTVPFQEKAYGQFAKLYEFVANLEKRFEHPFKLILITLERKEGEESSSITLEQAMFYMDRAIRISIRDVDIVTQYNSRQFLVIMLGTDLSGVNVAVDRIFKSYFRMSGSNVFSPSYSIVGTDNLKAGPAEESNKIEC